MRHIQSFHPASVPQQTAVGYELNLFYCRLLQKYAIAEYKQCMTPNDIFIDIGFRMHVREWGALTSDGSKTPFILVHGLASNAQTWDGVARVLAEAGHPTVAIDQRGHGMSDKPELAEGYNFETVTGDLMKLIEALGWEKPILAGQSWGGNVMLAFGANYPGIASGFVWVDGGFFDLQSRIADWEVARVEMAPPKLEGTPREQMKEWMQAAHPDWSDEGLEGQLANFAVMQDGTIKPHLTLDRHLAILQSMWEQRPRELYPQVREPVLICPAGDDQFGKKRGLVEVAQEGLECVEVAWFEDAPHDIHVAQPEKLGQTVLNWLKE